MDIEALRKAPLAKSNLVESKINLHKKITTVGFDKRPTQVIAVIDQSGSMHPVHQAHVLEGIVSPAAAIGLTFDDNGELPVYGFSDRVRRYPVLTEANHKGYVDRHIHPDGGTSYSPAMMAVLEDLQPGDPALVMFFTDGLNSDVDNQKVRYLLQKSSGLPIMWMFFGVYPGGNKPHFGILDNLDRELPERQVNNTSFMAGDLTTLIEDAIFEEVLTKFGNFSTAALEAGILNDQMKWTNNPFLDRGPINSNQIDRAAYYRLSHPNNSSNRSPFIAPSIPPVIPPTPPKRSIWDRFFRRS